MTVARQSAGSAHRRDGAGFVSGAGEFLRRRLMEIVGLGLIAAAAAQTLALTSYSAQDPSFNRATDDAVNNLLGPFGAFLADIELQYFGVATLLVPLVLLAWAWRVLTSHRWPRWWMRVFLLPVALLLIAGAVSVLPKGAIWPLDWPLEASLGGVLGANLVETLSGSPSVEPWMAALGCAGLGGLLMLVVSGLGGIGFTGFFAAPKKSGTTERTKRARPRVAEAPPRARSGLRADPDAGSRSRETAPQLKSLDEDTSAPPRAKRDKRKEPTFSLPEDEQETAAPERHPEIETADDLLDEPTLPTPTKRGRDTLPALAEPERPVRAPDLVAEPAPRAKAGRHDTGSTQRKFEFASGVYEPPSLALLAEPPHGADRDGVNRDSLEKNARLLETVLQDFGVRGEIVKVRPGPVVTRYELAPAPGTKTSRVVGLADDIARSMSAISVRVAVVPGSNVIGIELPNTKRETVYLHELLASQAFERVNGKLPLILGKDISGMPQMVDLARMPHLLIAGTTGSGKSVALNAMILSLLYRLPPDKCKFIMVDPKMLELSVYDDIPHLLAPVVTEPKKAIVALKWTVREMENRYRAMSQLGVRNIDGYNTRVGEAEKRGETLTRKVQTGFDPETGQPIHEEQTIDLAPLPYIVVVIDEMADLMLVAGKDVEAAVQRLSQMARAAGIHLMMATQRPSVDVITGTIKANFPSRISFHVTSKIDSRTILGEMGAEQLLGQGDMLFMAQGGRIARVHGPLVTDQEVEDVVAHLKSQALPQYIEAITEDEEPEFGGLGGEGDGSGDELYDRAVALVCRERKASTSFVQRHLQIGYNRAARLIERMESEGVIGPANHVGKREIIGRNIDED